MEALRSFVTLGHTLIFIWPFESSESVLEELPFPDGFTNKIPPRSFIIDGIIEFCRVLFDLNTPNYLNRISVVALDGDFLSQTTKDPLKSLSLQVPCPFASQDPLVFLNFLALIGEKFGLDNLFSDESQSISKIIELFCSSNLITSKSHNDSIKSGFVLKTYFYLALREVLKDRAFFLSQVKAPTQHYLKFEPVNIILFNFQACANFQVPENSFSAFIDNELIDFQKLFLEVDLCMKKSSATLILPKNHEYSVNLSLLTCLPSSHSFIPSDHVHAQSESPKSTFSSFYIPINTIQISLLNLLKLQYKNLKSFDVHGIPMKKKSENEKKSYSISLLMRTDDSTSSSNQPQINSDKRLFHVDFIKDFQKSFVYWGKKYEVASVKNFGGFCISTPLNLNSSPTQIFIQALLSGFPYYFSKSPVANKKLLKDLPSLNNSNAPWSHCIKIEQNKMIIYFLNEKETFIETCLNVDEESSSSLENKALYSTMYNVFKTLLTKNMDGFPPFSSSHSNVKNEITFIPPQDKDTGGYYSTKILKAFTQNLLNPGTTIRFFDESPQQQTNNNTSGLDSSILFNNSIDKIHKFVLITYKLLLSPTIQSDFIKKYELLLKSLLNYIITNISTLFPKLQKYSEQKIQLIQNLFQELLLWIGNFQDLSIYHGQFFEITQKIINETKETLLQNFIDESLIKNSTTTITTTTSSIVSSDEPPFVSSVAKSEEENVNSSAKAKANITSDRHSSFQDSKAFISSEQHGLEQSVFIPLVPYLSVAPCKTLFNSCYDELDLLLKFSMFQSSTCTSDLNEDLNNASSLGNTNESKLTAHFSKKSLLYHYWYGDYNSTYQKRKLDFDR